MASCKTCHEVAVGVGMGVPLAIALLAALASVVVWRMRSRRIEASERTWTDWTPKDLAPQYATGPNNSEEMFDSHPIAEMGPTNSEAMFGSRFLAEMGAHTE